MDIIKMSNKHIDECVDLFIDVFTKAPWHDTYSSRKQVVSFFQNYMANNYFVGYVLKEEASIIALSIGMKKPWINGMEYYIDQFCVKTDLQGKGIGSYFLKLIENEIQTEKMNAIILNTERGFPAEKFYKKNGFQSVDELITLTK
ncbi:MAG: GNAT family N-acetyltransferase [Clostridium sp.]|mgnify:FL=1|uniref:GNAT family N-acetyltransferase n=1 Tax=Anaeromassilibacillus senegalensis TaxID=1673717 RepID=A0ABS9MJP4_9FIRM|nr:MULTISPECIES: GNAT family N-acetyltransferase [Bacillota]MCC2832654.1 GNAT family N-acetyltransferase [[Clostridium] innocuum]MCG4611025.1 GNAT family N-acetyltransferase [Anaeromassilibacillus senegalensis]MCR0248092.1 GNAT family N-acetyltransferase [[Clostridium] innocuum]MCR0260817.1 GNAT family N-acetyltransferase [[Clostridium] innocuum]MCR0505832.1 GNAT family N-acetyltransferase [[Clostridium] innocuum]